MRLKQPPAMMGRLPSTIKAPPKLAEDFYRSREWKQLMVHLKARRGPWCQRCGSLHRVAGDHIIERKDGGAELDPSNIELLCQACHNAKTKRSAADRVKTRL
jgi:5-methylcytosine-specific restriction enzyme A